MGAIAIPSSLLITRVFSKMSSSSSSSSSEWESAPVVAKKSLPGPTDKTKTKKVTIAGSKSAKSSTTAKKPTYTTTTMITQSKGSSRAAIMKHIAGATNAVPNALLVNKALKNGQEGPQVTSKKVSKVKVAAKTKKSVAKPKVNSGK